MGNYHAVFPSEKPNTWGEYDPNHAKVNPKNLLPDPEDLADGSVAVLVNGKWEVQDEYGYSETVTELVVPFETVTTTEDEETSVISGEFSDEFDLVLGKTYTVSVNGKFYDIECIQNGDNLLLGELNDSGISFEHYPFAISKESTSCVLYTKEEGEFEVSVSYDYILVHKFDSKYIPSFGVVIEAEENATVAGYQVPKLTVDDVTRAYNAVISANPCVITDALGTSHFVVNQADIVSGDTCIELLYYSTLLLTYTVTNNEVVISYYEIGG